MPHSRSDFGRALPDEMAQRACTHLLAALRYYRTLEVKIKQVNERWVRLTHHDGLPRCCGA